MVLMYPRTVKVRSKSGTVNEYVRVVEAYREGSKVKQRVVADLGRKDLLLEVLPKLVFDSSPAILAVSPFAMERQLYSLATHGATS